MQIRLLTQAFARCLSGLFDIWLAFLGLALLAQSSFAFEIPHNDQNLGCISSDKADQLIKDFRIDIKSFGGLELCNNAIDTKKLFNDLVIIEGGRFEPSTPNKLIPGFIPATEYYAWLKEQTRGIERGNDLPFATAYNIGGFFTVQNSWARMATLGRVGTLIHEARHTMGYKHRRCGFGPYTRTSLAACDRSYDEGGSHAVEMEYYARVSVQGQNFHPVYRAMARLMAMGRTNWVFNKSPITKRQGLLIYNPNNVSYVLDGDALIARKYPSVAGKLRQTSFGASVFDGLTSWALEVYENIPNSAKIVDDYSYLKLAEEIRPSSAKRLLDLEEIDKSGARHFVVLMEDGQYASYDFAKGAFRGFLGPLPRGGRLVNRNSEGVHGLFYVRENQQIFEMNFSQGRFNPQRSIWSQNLQQVFLFNNEPHWLQKDGTILRKDSQGAFFKEAHFESLLTPESQLVEVPLYDAFQVQL